MIGVRQMKKIIFIVSIIVIALFALTAYVAIGEKHATASGHYEWLPVMGLSDGKFVGTGVDAVQQIGKDLDTNIESKNVGSWSQVQEKLKTGEIDFVFAIYWTEERSRYIRYSVDYTTDPIVAYFANGRSFPLNQKEDLVGKRGVVTKGDSYGTELDKFIVESNLDIVETITPERAFSMLKSGEADYFLYSAYAGRALIARENLSGFEESKTISEQLFYVGVSKKSPYANQMDAINASLRRQMANPNSSLYRSH